MQGSATLGLLSALAPFPTGASLVAAGSFAGSAALYDEAETAAVWSVDANVHGVSQVCAAAFAQTPAVAGSRQAENGDGGRASPMPPPAGGLC